MATIIAITKGKVNKKITIMNIKTLTVIKISTIIQNKRKVIKNITRDEKGKYMNTTKRVANYIKERGIRITAISEATGIPVSIIYPSLGHLKGRQYVLYVPMSSFQYVFS